MYRILARDVTNFIFEVYIYYGSNSVVHICKHKTHAYIYPLTNSYIYTHVIIYIIIILYAHACSHAKFMQRLSIVAIY